MRLKPGVPLDLKTFQEAIRKAGYETRDFVVTLTGRVEREGRQFRLRPDGVDQVFLLRVADPGHLAAFAGKRARVRGRVVEAAAPLEVELTEITSPEAR